MSNTLTAYLVQKLAAGLPVLRSRVTMARLASQAPNIEGSAIAGPNEYVQIPIHGTKTAATVTPSSTPLSPTDAVNTYANVQLSEWKKADFYMTDKEMNQIEQNDAYVQREINGCMEALARGVNSYLFGLADNAVSTGVPGGVFNAVGIAGTRPFASNYNLVNDASALLNSHNAPLSDRVAVLDFQAAANLKNLTSLSADKRGDNEMMMSGSIGELFGVDFYEDGQVPNHVSTGTAATCTIGTTLSTSNVLSLLCANATHVYSAGDILEISGVDQTFMVAVGKTASSNVATLIQVTPAVGSYLAGVTSGAAVTQHIDDKMNLLFQRGAFAFANRPLGTVPSVAMGDSAAIVEMTDPFSGLTVRLEVFRQYKQWVWVADMLYGGALVRPELACRIMG